MKQTKKIYRWQGINYQGERLSGELFTISPLVAKIELRKKGIITKQIRKKIILFNKIVNTADIAFFSRQLAVMLKAGISLSQSLNLIAQNTRKLALTRLIEDIKTDLENSLSFSESLEQHPDYFNQLTRKLIAVGEQSGQLEIMLDKIATHNEKMEYVKKKLRKALAYPLIVCLIAFSVSIVLLTCVVPQFESIFSSFETELPFLTCLIINLSNFFKNYYLMISLILGGLIFLLKIVNNRSDYYFLLFDKFSLKLPLLGNILKTAIITRFIRTLAITYSAGLPLIESLNMITTVTGNSIYTNAAQQICAEIANGYSIERALRNTRLFPDLVMQMIAIGENSGTLEIMLYKLADFYDEEIDNAIELLTQLLEPAIIAILGLIVGTLVIAMYLPIFKLGSMV